MLKIFQQLSYRYYDVFMKSFYGNKLIYEKFLTFLFPFGEVRWSNAVAD